MSMIIVINGNIIEATIKYDFKLKKYGGYIIFFLKKEQLHIPYGWSRGRELLDEVRKMLYFAIYNKEIRKVFLKYPR